MIQKVICYKAFCDRCGKSNDWVWGTPDKALSVAMEVDDWREIGGKLYCSDCYEYDEKTDEYKPKKDKL
ncbi:hypothetical protein [Bacteroides sp. ET225]|uniref:hypothetical protein n=1 Tax=Bacteroides sp. ET225 TaxID=2972461 RepID=UPI0021AD27B6|nr:hypothetical protein [Bacteroides sp. ET225]MCR8919203.1 hypothetical protein [Bacteroides sp. ET225]